MDLLTVQHISFSYVPERPVYHDVSFTVHEGEVFTILGPNGAGKSTLLNAIAGLLAPDEGDVSICGKSVQEYSRKELAQFVGYIPQVISSVFQYTVMDYLVMGRAPYLSTFARPKQSDYDLAYEKLCVIGVERLKDRTFSELSGGERQQVAIARVLVQNPRLILLDEPTSALDFGNQMRVITMIQRLVNQGYSVILTTHTPDHAIILQGRVGALDRRGRLTVGSVQDIVTEPFLSQLYDADVRIEEVQSIGRKACFVR